MNEHELTGSIEERFEKLESRLLNIERHLGITETEAPAVHLRTTEPDPVLPVTPPPVTVVREDEDEFEFEVGQNLFAKIGIIVMAVGVAFLLSLPFDELPPAVPTILGYALVIALFLIAHFWRASFELISKYLRGAGMALLFFATLRLYFFGSENVLSTESVVGVSLLLVVFAVNLIIALKRTSPYLLSLTLATGFLTAIVIGSSWMVFFMLSGLAGLVTYAGIRNNWPSLLLFGIPGVYLTHLVWAINNPFLGNDIALVNEPHASLYFLLAYGVILAMGSAFRTARDREDFSVILSAILNVGFAYGIFLLHSALELSEHFALSHLIASAVFLGIAIVFWKNEQSRFSTFIYAMAGYGALSVSIIDSFEVPGVFVWLSVQSVVVVTTAIWFRSRFIVVANFLIYAVIVIAYVTTSTQETGISIGFGAVALISARILGWQQDRLELKTDKMRNAYLLSAFIIFPYSLYHLLPANIVPLSWVGIAGVYYLFNLIVRSQKYRWMGHGTLLLTVFYVVVIGVIQLEGTARILSFLVLGMALVIVSLIFTRLRSKKKSVEPDEHDE